MRSVGHTRRDGILSADQHRSDQLLLCFDSCGAYQQAILRSLSQHSDCCVWLTVPPTQPAYRMREQQIHLAVRIGCACCRTTICARSTV